MNNHFVFSVFFDENGTIDLTSFHTDGVHMNELGYERLQAVFTPIVNGCEGTALLTASHGNPSPDGRPGWPAMEGLTVEFIGGTGAEYWVGELYTIADTLESACQFIIMLGDNDLDSADARQPGLIFDDIQTLVDEAHSINPSLNVIVFTVMPRPAADDTDYEARRVALNQMLAEKLEGATLVDSSR